MEVASQGRKLGKKSAENYVKNDLFNCFDHRLFYLKHIVKKKR